MAAYDAGGKDAVEFDPPAWLGYLGQPRPADRARLIDADLSATASTAADKVIYVDDPDPWLVMIALHTYWDPDLRYAPVKRHALLLDRHRVPVSVVVVLLRPEANSSHMTGAFTQRNPLGRPWDFPFEVVPVCERPADDFLTGPLGLVPFAPLARVDAADAPRVKSIIADRLTREASRADRERLATCLVVLAGMRYTDDELDFWRDLMKTVDISYSTVANMFRDEGGSSRSAR